MKDKYQRILSDHPNIPAEKLLAYLEDRLGDRERLEVEMAMVESSFLSDAAEGLEQLGDTHRIQGMVDGLNRGLLRRTSQLSRRHKRVLAGFPGWLAFTVLILLILIVAGFFVLKLLSRT
jgi:hypothetical protein